MSPQDQQTSHASEIKPGPYCWYVRLIFWFQKRTYGTVLNPSLLWGQSPRVFLALTFLFRSIDRKKSPIAPGLRSLVLARISQINGCAFCIDSNTYLLMKRGVRREKVQDLGRWRESPHFDDVERITLEYTEAITSSKGKISEDLRERIKAFYTPQVLVDLTALIAFQNMSTTFNNAFGVKPQGFLSGFCALDQNRRPSREG